MTLTEIKKELYKQKPPATFFKAFKQGLVYTTQVIRELGGGAAELNTIWFTIPFSDIGDASFGPIESAQHLIRYIVTPENKTTNDKG